MEPLPPVHTCFVTLFRNGTQASRSGGVRVILYFHPHWFQIVHCTKLFRKAEYSAGHKKTEPVWTRGSVCVKKVLDFFMCN